MFSNFYRKFIFTFMAQTKLSLKCLLESVRVILLFRSDAGRFYTYVA